jgi:hypothetical protein
MNTNDLIQHLGNDLAPVQPLAPPWKRAALWLGCAGLYLAAVLVVAWMRGRSLLLDGSSLFVIQQFASLVTALIAAFAAFVSIIPGTNRRLLGAPVVPAAVVMMTLVWGCIIDVRMHGILGIGREADWPCVVSLTLGGTVLWVVAMAMLRRGAPLAPRVSALLAGVSALSVANIEACVSRRHMFSVTVLLWHGLTMALLISVLMQAGPRLLPWRRLER